MIGSLTRQTGAQVLHFEHADEEFGKFIDPFTQVGEFMMQRRIIKQGLVVVPYETHATGAGGHYIISSAEILHKLVTNGFCLIPVSGIECGLTTAGLRSIISNRTTGFF